MKTTKHERKAKSSEAPDTKGLYVDLPADLYRRVKIFMAQTDTWTDESGQSRSIQLRDVVKEALEEYLSRKEKRK